MKHIIITGGLGFIGSTFVEMHHERYRISILDKHTYASNPQRVADLSNVDIYKVDLANKEETIDTFKQLYDVDAILHLAAESHVDNSIKTPEPFIQSNIVGTFNLLEAAKDFGIPNIINVSTDETIEHTAPIVYSMGHEGTKKQLYFDRKKESNSTFKPSSAYSASKASGEMLAMSYRTTYGMKNLTTVRLCNQYGPYQHTEKLIPMTVSKIGAGEKIPVYKTTAYRDWCYVEDGCRALDLLLNLKKREELYHISAYNETETIDIVKKILGLMNSSEDLIELVEDRRGYDLVYSIDSSKVRSLGWTPEVNLEEGLRRTIKHYEKTAL